MPSEPPSIFGSVKTALVDAWLAFKVMPGPVLLTMLASGLIDAFHEAVYPSPPGVVGAGMVPFGFVMVVVSSAVTAPLAVMAHRRIILSEAGGRPSLRAIAPAILEFFVISVLVNLIIFIPAALAGATALLDLDEFYVVMLILLGVIVGLAAVVYYGIRLMLLFPAVAVQDPDRSVATAFAKTQGLFWRLFWIAMLITLAATALNAAVGWLAGLAGLKAIAKIVAAVVGTGTLVALVAVASRFYLWRGSGDAVPLAEPA